MKYIEFNSSINPNIGVKIELQLIDNVTFDYELDDSLLLSEVERSGRRGGRNQVKAALSGDEELERIKKAKEEREAQEKANDSIPNDDN